MPLIRFLVALLVVTAFASEAQACGRLAACLMRLFASEAEQDVVTIVVPPPGTQRARSVRNVELQINPLAPRWGNDWMEELFDAAYPQLTGQTDQQKRIALANWLQRLGNTTGVETLVYEYALPTVNGRSYGIHAEYTSQSGRLGISIEAPPANSTGYQDLGRLSQLGFDDTHEGLLLRAYHAFSGVQVNTVRVAIEDTDWPDFEAYEGGINLGLGRLMAADATPSGMFIGRLYGFSATGVMEAADTTPRIYTAIFGPQAAIQSNLAIDLPAQPQMKMKDLDPSGVGQMLQERRSLFEPNEEQLNESEEDHDDDEKEMLEKESSTSL